jgi:HEAT repeats
MWDNLRRVDWGRLTHAYGWARDVPGMLRGMIADGEGTRAKAWDRFQGAVNHQGDFYDSTVAVVPFLIEAVANPATPGRIGVLHYFRDRWREAPSYGGDAVVPEPPGGVDLPIPLLTDEAFAQAERAASASPGDDEEGDDDQDEEEFDIENYRRTDLCAWQTGRAIAAGRRTFERLLEDPDRAVAAAAAMLLLMWPQTRALAKRALIRTIVHEPEPLTKAERILELGVYATSDDEAALTRWLHHPGPVQAAAALVLAWLADPAPPPQPAAAVLEEVSQPNADGLARLPRAGVFERGPWILPANAAPLILRLAENENKELRWRAVQGLALRHPTASHLSAAQLVPVLLARLSDDYNRIRAAAASALAQRGEAVLDVVPDAVPVLLRALDGHRSRDWGDRIASLDSDASICGHAARLLALVSLRLTPAQRQQALAGIEQADRRYAGRNDEFVWFETLGLPVSSFLNKARDRLAQPRDWTLADLFAGFVVPASQDRLSPPDCDRRLAQAYARQPNEVVASAIGAVRNGSDRWAVMGAAQWLATLGPLAERALPALDGVAGGSLDSYAQDQVLAASKFIRQSLAIARERGADTSSVAALSEHLDHSDVVVRAEAAGRLALLSPPPEEAAAAMARLEPMLDEEAFAEIGIGGSYECGERLVHWRHERRSPRAGAVRALFAIGRVPRDDRALTAMLAEAMHAHAICGKSAEPPRFTIAQWRLAADAAGGLALAEPRIRAARQQCLREPWPGHSGPHVCEAELAEVIRVLSGRLGPA